jgi:periodic tryptophan protein 2
MSVAFNPNLSSTELASVSWDKTLKVWNAIENGSNHETIQLTADGLYVTYKPNGEEFAVATLDGQISFFDCKTGTQLNSIEGRNDLGSGRSDTDLVTAKKSLEGK